MNLVSIYNIEYSFNENKSMLECGLRIGIRKLISSFLVGLVLFYIWILTHTYIPWIHDYGMLDFIETYQPPLLP